MRESVEAVEGLIDKMQEAFVSKIDAVHKQIEANKVQIEAGASKASQIESELKEKMSIYGKQEDMSKL